MVQSTNATLHSTIRQIAIIVSTLSPCLSIAVSSFIACLLVGLSQLPSLTLYRLVIHCGCSVLAHRFDMAAERMEANAEFNYFDGTG